MPGKEKKQMFKPTREETSAKLTYTKQDIQNEICDQLTKDGYSITSKAWNETNSKFEVIATKPEKKGGK